MILNLKGIFWFRGRGANLSINHPNHRLLGSKSMQGQGGVIMTTCGSCLGTGKVSCSGCGGSGRISRFTSLGGGGVEINPCAVCSGSGRMRCDFCGGTGQVGSAGSEPVTQTPSLSFGPLICPKCSAEALRGSFKVWQIVVAILFFPVGLLALLASRNPNKCPECGYTWQG